MKISSLVHKVIFGQGVTPLPSGICVTTFLLILCNGMIITNVFPYLPELVKVFGASEVDAAKKAGYMASSMFMTRIFSSIMWGFICDKFGTKLALLLSGTSLAVSTILFGFSINYSWAIIARSVQGLCMGTFFDNFKIVIPNILFASGILFSLLVTAFLLPKKKQNSKEQEIIVQNDSLQNSVMDSNVYLNYSITTESIQTNMSEKSRLIGSKQSGVSKLFLEFKNTKLAKLLGNRYYLLMILIYSVYCLLVVGQNELFPVFAAALPKYSGLGMTTSDIGLLFLIVSILLLISQMTILNKLTTRFGSKKVFCASTFLYGIFVVLVPISDVIQSRSALWVTTSIIQICVRVTSAAGFLAINIFINNSVESDMLGLANGLAMSAASIGSSIGAVAFGNAFTWSMKNIKKAQENNTTAVFPINQYFAFVLMSFISFFLFFCALCIPSSLNKKNIRNEKQNSAVVVTTSYFRFEQC
ncbi:uncharacterized protein LOC100212961 isoform X2 [Hydra vulgaris]|uniref:uncharacterized protein LOC100212961 isoform X2 n=1 Tax=Hydra vulgaris TaxID=6087 RepID=UPI001F5FE5DD|nr:protein ZINC INDUCED FACILITATOR-LIKE 1-like isoform X2 [Hydra vulgaris]